MTYYPYVAIDDALGRYECGYEREDEIPADSCKPQWEALRFSCVIRLFVGYQSVIVPFPSDKLFYDFASLLGNSFFGGREYLRFMRHLLPILKRYNIPSDDYYCYSNHPNGREPRLNYQGISDRMFEWFDATNYHFLTLSQFCEIDFNKYFDITPREDNSHYDFNMSYLARLIFKNGPHNTDKHGNYLGKAKKRNQRAKIEDMLRTNVAEFAIDHFAKYIRTKDHSMYKY
jgi:hypothetical protein